MALSLNSANSLQSLRQAGTLVQGMSLRQKLILAGSTLAVVAAIGLFVYYMNPAPDSVLYSGLAPADAQQVTGALASLGVPYQLSPDDTSVSVPPDQLDRARLALAAQGLPHTGQLGFELFDKTNWSGSDFAEQVNYQRALEGELERTIETIQDVSSARVHITMAHDSLFTADERQAKAAVVLSLRDGNLQPNMVTAIQHLVASSVEHLSPARVSILDSNGDIALAGSGTLLSQARLEDQLSAKIVSTLAPIVGAQHVRASVNVAYDPTSADDTQETYDPTSSAVLTSQRSVEGGTATTAAAGVPGTTSNLPKAQAPGTNLNAELGLSSSPRQQSDSQTFAVSRTLDHTIRPAGTLQRITAAVVVDDSSQTVTQNGKTQTVRQPRSPAEMQQLQSLVAAAIGLDPARGDALTVTNLPFTAPAPLAAPSAPAPLATGNRFLRLPIGGKWIAVGVAGLLLVGLLFGRMRRRPQAAPAPQAAALAAAAAAAQLPPGAELAVASPAGPPEVRREAEMLNMTELLAADPEITPPEVKQVLQLKARVAERVRREPAIASRLIQVWMSKRREERAT
ncbi:MAG TPA: flagellar basal-body MS-ring/collar protein FliF [Terriglobales bacterium]|nr:flagellar basal-body MS-ring/collar protein FliF [Terriglobales bacterium]